MIIRSPILDFFFFFGFKSNTVRSISSARFFDPAWSNCILFGLVFGYRVFFCFFFVSQILATIAQGLIHPVPPLSRRLCSATDAFKSPWPFHGWRQIFNSAYKFHDFLFFLFVFSFGVVDQLKGVKQKRKWSSNRSKTEGEDNDIGLMGQNKIIKRDEIPAPSRGILDFFRRIVSGCWQDWPTSPLPAHHSKPGLRVYMCASDWILRNLQGLFIFTVHLAFHFFRVWVAAAAAAQIGLAAVRYRW